MERRLVGLAYICSCLSEFVIIPCEYLLHCSGCLTILSDSSKLDIHKNRSKSNHIIFRGIMNRESVVGKQSKSSACSYTQGNFYTAWTTNKRHMNLPYSSSDFLPSRYSGGGGGGGDGGGIISTFTSTFLELQFIGMYTCPLVWTRQRIF
jgi:hypothetical protein